MTDHKLINVPVILFPGCSKVALLFFFFFFFLFHLLTVALSVIDILFVMFEDKYSCILGVIILLCYNPVTLLIRAPDKRDIEDNSKMIFSYFSRKTYVVTPH